MTQARSRGDVYGFISQWQRFAKTIQVYEITMAAGDTSKAQALATAVTKSKSFAVFLGHRSTQNTDGSRYKCRVELTDNNNVTVYRTTASSAAQTVTGCIVVVHLHNWAVVNVDHGTVTITAASSAFVTPAFTPSIDKDTLCIYLGNTTSKTGGSSRLSGLHAEVAYTIGNNRVTATVGDGSLNYVVGYCLIQFAKGIIKTKNEVLLTLNASTTIQDVTQAITAVNAASTIVFNGGERYTDGFSGTQIRGYLNTSTELKASADAPYNFATRRVRVTAMEFYPQYVRRSFRGAVSFAGNPQDVDQALGFTGVQARLMPNYIGFSMTNSFSNEDYNYATWKIKDADEGTADRDSVSGTATNVPTPSVEVFELR